jgi:coenzyme F420-reducing hydrogenase beta subunit
MINISNKNDCCGCTACASICPRNAITMKPDSLGFFYPEVDKDKCIECELCVKVCSFHDNYDKSLNFDTPLVFGARHKNINEVKTSRSGAAFIAISDIILETGGIVYGVGYENHLYVCHKRATTRQERDEFKGSKYVQSDLRKTFIQIKQDLKDGKHVLFSGTPCQTSGLNSFIGKKLRSNLILVDIVCHGVPSPYIWKDYINYYETKFKKEIKTFNFRDKVEYGWKAHKETFILEDEQKIKVKYSPFSFLFGKSLILRQSCGHCHFCNIHRPSDITLADFWGWEKSNLDINKDDLGLSLLLINTSKGLDLFNKARVSLMTFDVNLKDCLQPNLKHPTTLNSNRNNFELDYQNNGFEYILKKYTLCGYKNRFIYNLRHIINRIIK